ncbi:MAG: hypothetical protein LUD07_11320 [Clostridiales bacterium]|nr:hypothetical protein [Clostridiales bacterium]
MLNVGMAVESVASTLISQNPDERYDTDSDAYAAYEVILDEYRAACAVDAMSYFADMETYEAMYPDVNPFELYEYHVPYHVNQFNDSEYEKHELMYTYYDIDQNGTPELLIFESSWQQDICDIYAFDGTVAVKLFPDITLLDTRDMEFVSAAIYDDGTLCLMTGDSSPYRFNTDGYTLETIPWDEWDWNRDKLVSFDADMEILAQDIPSDEHDMPDDMDTETYAPSSKEGHLWNPSDFIGKRYRYDNGSVIYDLEFYEKEGATRLSLGTGSSGGTGTGLAGIDIILEADKVSYEDVNVVVEGIGVVETNNRLQIVPEKDRFFIEWKDKQGNTIVAADFYSIADTDQTENIPIENEMIESSSDITQTFTGSCGSLQKDGDRYYYSGEIMGYDESLVVDDDWTTGRYVLTSGTFYTDETTKIIIETDSDYGFSDGEKSAVEWLDDFYARKEYWMTVNIKVKGDHIEEILGIYSIC